MRYLIRLLYSYPSIFVSEPNFDRERLYRIVKKIIGHSIHCILFGWVWIVRRGLVWIIEIKDSIYGAKHIFSGHKMCQIKTERILSLVLVIRSNMNMKWRSIKMIREMRFVEPEQLNLRLKQLHWAFNGPMLLLYGSLSSIGIGNGISHMDACYWGPAVPNIQTRTRFHSISTAHHIWMNYKFLGHRKQI